MYERDLTETPNGGSFGIRSIFEDKEGSFWFCNTLHRYLINRDNADENGKIKYKKIEGLEMQKSLVEMNTFTFHTF